MPKKKKTVAFDSAIDNIEEDYIRGGGKDPYVLTLLTRAQGDNKKKKDKLRKKAVSGSYDTMKRSLIKQYNDVELENVRLLTELMSLQEQIKKQINQRGTIMNPSGTEIYASKPSRNATYKSEKVLEDKHVSFASESNNDPLSAFRKSLGESVLPLIQPGGIANLPGPFPFFPGLPGLQNNLPNALPINLPSLHPTHQTNPYGNTYIVTGDEVHINDGERMVRNTHWNKHAEVTVGNSESPTLGFDADWQEPNNDGIEEDETFYLNHPVPQGPYDFSNGILVFFDFAIQLPKEARFCRLSVGLLTSGRMKPPISFPALPTEQFSPGDHPEFRHFTTVCQFGYCVAVSGGKPSPQSKGGISLVVELMVSTDKPVDEQAPVYGWSRQGWCPITATRKADDDPYGLTTYAGRYRTLLRRSLPLARDADGLLEFISESKQQMTSNKTELFYRIANAQQSQVERLAPVGIKYIEFYDDF